MYLQFSENFLYYLVIRRVFKVCLEIFVCLEILFFSDDKGMLVQILKLTQMMTKTLDSQYLRIQWGKGRQRFS